VLVLGPTGYIGRFVTKELIARGYKARPLPARLAVPLTRAAGDRLLAREERHRRQENGGGDGGGFLWSQGGLRRRQGALGDFALRCALTQLPQSMDSLRATAFAEKVDVICSCLASRTGGIQARLPRVPQPASAG